MKTLIEIDNDAAVLRIFTDARAFDAALVALLCGRHDKAELDRCGLRVLGVRDNAEPYSITWGSHHRTENQPPCDHKRWNYDLHGNACPCGKIMRPMTAP